MKRLRSLACRLPVFALILMLGGVPLVASRHAHADDAAATAPVKRIVMFNSGVGYFEHQGEVDGNATVELKFDVEDVNDLLKSMVLEDRGGGTISTVTYSSRDPITKTLKSFAIDLTTSPSLGQLLAQIRGERVALDAGRQIEGAIVGVEKQRQATPKGQLVEVEYLTLLTEEGLQRVELDSIRRIKLVRKELDAEFRQALKVLASGLAEDKKSVTLQFKGEGRRAVRVGYIQEAPVWKTSYRLVLDNDEKPFLQGWAIVENTTDDDWNDVRLSLVSGRPISFTMDLYSPLYAQRPVVVPELYASLRPQSYEQDLKANLLDRRALERSSSAAAVPAAAPAPEAAEKSAETRYGVPARRAAGYEGQAAGLGDLINDAYGRGDAGAGRQMGRMSISEGGVESAAQGGDVGELFQYDIAAPVTLARQSSAMLPIVNDEIDGKKVSIYSTSAHPKHPLNGVRIENTSKLHLMQGPVTVFDDGVYAGDARLPDVPAGGERLISYALDLDVEVAPTSDAKPQRLVSAKIDKGVMTSSYKQTRKLTYAVKNSGDAPKALLVEHPLEASWKLVAPKEPAEKTRDMYRFAVDAEPGKTVKLTIEEEQTLREQTVLTNLDYNAIQIFLASDELSDEIKNALREVVRRQTELATLRAKKQQLEAEIAAIGQEQDRIRPTMQTIDRNTDLYNRYMKKFAEQEDRIETLRDEIATVEGQTAEAQKALDGYLSDLDLQ